MNIEDYREYCLSVKGATECMPFDKHTLVFKVMDKMFSFATLSSVLKQPDHQWGLYTARSYPF